MTSSPDLELSSDTSETIRHQVRVEFRIYLVIVAVVSLVAGGYIGKYLFTSRSADVVVETANQVPLLRFDPPDCPTLSLESEMLTVYVSGAVNNSRIVTLSADSLVIDAIQAAGGASPEADMDAINLAESLRDHDHILVPRYAESGTAQTGKISLNINTATAFELESLPNIGPARAQQIVAYRESHGAFQSVEDIMLVSGIGSAIYAELAPFIYVDGQ